MDDTEAFEDNNEERGYDNDGANLSSVHFVTQVVYVKPKLDANDDEHESLRTKSPTNNEIRSLRRHSSLESIEQIDIGNGHISIQPYFSGSDTEVKVNKKKTGNISKSNSKLKNKESLQDKDNSEQYKPTYSFEETVSLSDLIINPLPEISIPNHKTDLQRFLMTPPPIDVIARCQINKTNSIDKTLYFTNFIFSLQMSDTNSSPKKPIEIMMVAHPNRNPKRFSYTISSDISDVNLNSQSIVGKLESNFLGKRFNIFSKNISTTPDNEDNSANSEDESNTNQSVKGNFNHTGVIFYKSTHFGSGKPREIDVFMPKWNSERESYETSTLLPKDRNEAVNSPKEDIIRLEFLKPQYDEVKKYYILNFEGRAELKSVKNFALTMKVQDRIKRVFQFGKCKGHFIVDFTYPICAVQAFAMALSCCQRKIASD